MRVLNCLPPFARLPLPFVAAILLSPLGGGVALPAAEQPAAVLASMERVADWQLAHPSAHPATDWTVGAGDAGFMALAGISANPKYRDAMLAAGESNQWQLGPRLFHADDCCVGQTYAELNLLYGERKMLIPLRARLDYILARQPQSGGLDFRAADATDHWSWCDSLFMGPPTWMRVYAATGDPIYMDFAVTNWQRTADFLYDKQEHLFYRDSTYFDKTEANGKKIFWSRGNGWVMAGLVRVLEYLPMNHPSRPRFEQMFKEMSEKVLALQQPDGLWRSSLLDPADYPAKETSGSGFFTYALAWGVNQGLLDKAAAQSAVEKAWDALNACVDADGKLTHVQPIGADPKSFSENSTEVYGVGAFLLAGSEVYRMAVLQNVKAEIIKVTNPSAFRRDHETVELDNHTGLQFSWDRSKNNLTAVMDGLSSKILPSQNYTFDPYMGPPTDSTNRPFVNRVVFQVDLAPGESRQYYVMSAADLPATPPAILKTFARYVPERDDDFAWESDRIAHRIYGQKLARTEGTITSGPDVWIKKNRDLMIDKMYQAKKYHEDNGTEMDDYRVGNGGRGCGGSGIWDGTKLWISGNYVSWKLITTGPVRSEFQLTYDPWVAGANGRKVSMTERISIDAGSYFSRMQTVFNSEDSSPLTVAVGLAERPGQNKATYDLSAGWVAYWQPEDPPKGTIGVGLLLQPGSVSAFANDKPNLPASAFVPPPPPSVEGTPPIRNMLCITQVGVGKTLDYYFGACWDRSRDFVSAAEWESYIRQLARRHAEPLVVSFVSK